MREVIAMAGSNFLGGCKNTVGRMVWSEKTTHLFKALELKLFSVEIYYSYQNRHTF